MLYITPSVKSRVFISENTFEHVTYRKFYKAANNIIIVVMSIRVVDRNNTTRGYDFILCMSSVRK